METSIVVPAYNEENRIPQFLNKLIEYSRKHIKKHEIIIVNDGSTDRTKQVVNNIIRYKEDARLISYKRNRGKGYAVRKGVMEARGKYILFIDADGSIAPDQIPPMLSKLKKYDVVVGSRKKKDSKTKASSLRVFIGTVFNWYVNIFYKIDIWDNLCGFKGFKKKAAKELFKGLISKRWIFDVELFYKIRKRNYSMYELPIKWLHKEGTKISMIDPLRMAWQLLVLRIKLM